MAVVLLAPIGLGRSTWELVGDLAEIGISVEYPCSPGLTARRSRYPSLGEMAEQIITTAPAPLDVIGMSMGGVVAQHVAALHPGKVRSVLLGCCPTEIDSPAMAERSANTRRLGMTEMARRTMPRWFSGYNELNEDRLPVLAVRHTLEQLDTEDFALAQLAMMPHRLAELPQINAPTTYLTGCTDPASPLTRVQDMLAQIPGSRAEVIRGGHLPQLEHPEEYRAAVQRHLDWAGTGVRIASARRPTPASPGKHIRLHYVTDGNNEPH
jgi:pimeloyl-ACP methyl ester carboxylesterase